MKICHVCGFSCEDDAELCPICGAELKFSEDISDEEITEDAVIELENPELAESIEDPVTAEIYCDLLKEEGIIFTSDESELSGAMHFGFGGFYSEINIYVDKKDLDRAKEIFDNMETADIQFEDDFQEEN